MKTIRDERGRLKATIIENGNVVYVRDQHGQLKGEFIKSANKTYDGRGRYFGNGDQLLNLLN